MQSFFFDSEVFGHPFNFAQTANVIAGHAPQGIAQAGADQAGQRVEAGQHHAAEQNLGTERNNTAG